MTEFRRIGDLRDVRYGEMLILHHGPDGFYADVWNTMGFNDCPPEEFAAIDGPAEVARLGALGAIHNGPRRWTFDTIESDPTNGWLTAPKETFGTLQMFLAATVRFGDAAPTPGEYVERAVARDNFWEFDAHKPRFFLVNPDGVRYVLQAYALYVDATQSFATLPTLGERLALPAGWRFLEDRAPSKILRVHTGPEKLAAILQDELGNSYMRCTHVDEVEPA